MTDLSMTEPLTTHIERETATTGKPFLQRVKGCCYCGKRLKFLLQCLHFAISMTFLWAGIVEFINHPPYFDAYGDAKKNTDELPKNIMHVSLLYFNLNIIKLFMLLMIYIVSFRLRIL